MKNFLFLLIAGVLLSGCMTFEKAHLRYAKTTTDTTYNTVKVVVPRDSAVLVVKTDTTYLKEHVIQGRARVTIERTRLLTTVQADCDSAVIEKKVPVYITKQVWGVDPVYQKRADRWRTVSFVLIGLLVVAVIAYLLMHKYQLSIAKR